MPQIAALFFTAFVFTFGSSGCEFQRPLTAPMGYETGDAACNDGRDNDHDGLPDCADPDCVATSGWCGENVPLIPYVTEENTYELCNDQIDNDNDGQMDCGDRMPRQLTAENCCSREFSDDLCSDGIDNDQNGYVDCQDFGCRMGDFVTVCVENTDALCSDEIDNDGDGDIDCADYNCSGLADCPAEEAENTATDCTDVAEGPEETLTYCQDGCDNDGDGYVDCADYSCSQSDDPQVLAYCDSLSESSLEKCSDGIDNDGNGYTDCEDYSCNRDGDAEAVAHCSKKWKTRQRSAAMALITMATAMWIVAISANSQADDITVAQVCQESITATGSAAEANQKCSDGLDNDGDGFTDCNDWDCSWNPLVTVCADNRICE